MLLYAAWGLGTGPDLCQANSRMSGARLPVIGTELAVGSRLNWFQIGTCFSFAEHKPHPAPNRDVL